MKIKFIPTEKAPDNYSINETDVVITASYDGDSEDFDLSIMEEGDVFGDVLADVLENEIHGCQPQILNIAGEYVIRDSWRDSEGDLRILLCQEMLFAADWNSSDWIDAEAYDSAILYIQEVA